MNRASKLRNVKEQSIVRLVKRTEGGESRTYTEDIVEKRLDSGKLLTIGKAIALIGLYLSTAYLVGSGEFVAMESVKNPSFSLGTCQVLLGNH